MKIAQIVPRMPCDVCGVGDYSRQLARTLKDSFGVESIFVAPTRGPSAAVDVEGFSTYGVERKQLSCFAQDVLRHDLGVVLLHYSGYGYQKRGVPYWLLRELRKFRSAIPVVTMFHELYATGTLGTSAFWLGPCMKEIAGKIAASSVVVHTNRQEAAQWLRRHVLNGTTIKVHPISSNLGESTCFTPPSLRTNSMVIFQPPSADSARGEIYWHNWRRVCSELKPSRVIVAGRAKSVPPDSVIDNVGYVSAADADKILSEARWAYADYYDGYLAKSSVFAAVASHGLACILATSNRSEADGLYEGKHFITPGSVAEFAHADRMDSMARNLMAWYGHHSVKATARAFFDSLSEASER